MPTTNGGRWVVAMCAAAGAVGLFMAACDTGTAASPTGTPRSDAGLLTQPTEDDSGTSDATTVDSAVPDAALDSAPVYPADAEPPTWTNVYGTIISPRCGMKCHSSASHTAGLDMGNAADAYTHLVGVAATGDCAGNGDFISASHPETSVLFSKISSDTPVCGKRVPRDGPPYLPQQQIDIVSAWIAMGAQND